MYEKSNSNTIKLKECYELAAQYESDPTVKEILQQKAQKIHIQDDIEAEIGGEHNRDSFTMQTVSNAMRRLSLEGMGAMPDTSFVLAKEIDLLPENGETELLRAILVLRSGMNESQRLESLRHLNNALSYARNDPRCVALAKILQEAEQ